MDNTTEQKNVTEKLDSLKLSVFLEKEEDVDELKHILYTNSFCLVDW